MDLTSTYDTTVRTFATTIALDGGLEYHFVFVLVPPKLPYDHPARQDFDDRSIDVDNELGSAWIKGYCGPANDNPVVVATFAATTDAVRCDTIDVVEAHRRRGIATTVYDSVGELLSLPVVPSDVLSDEAKAFWASRSN